MDSWYTLPRDIQLAWAAGYLDGESYLSIPSLTIQVDSVDPTSIERLFVLFGGTVVFYKQRSDRTSPIWRWRIYGKAAEEVGRDLLPLLCVKRDEMECLISRRYYPETTYMGQLLEDRMETVKQRKRQWRNGSLDASWSTETS
jgi:hypothetical protein